MSGNGKVLFVVTNYGEPLIKGGTSTGWYLPEAAHPYTVIKDASYAITFVSPKGGKAPMDVGSGKAFEGDDICKKFLEEHSDDLEKTLSPAEVKASDYKGLFYVGGHGPMFDVAKDAAVATLARDIYENGGIIGAVCHGPAGLVPVVLSTGEPLVKGQTVTSFTNAEEDVMQLSKAMPFMLETKLSSLGAKFEGGADWSCNVKVSGRLVTGQNPNSATECGKEMVKLLNKVKR